jgi:hypothetical protein
MSRGKALARINESYKKVENITPGEAKNLSGRVKRKVRRVCSEVIEDSEFRIIVENHKAKCGHLLELKKALNS